MLGTKAVLAAQKPKPVARPVLKLIAKGPYLNWDLDKVAEGFGLTRQMAGEHAHDGRLVNPNVSLTMACKGFDRVPDKKSGFFLISHKTGACYRLRVARLALDLPPSKNKGMNRSHDPKSVSGERQIIDGHAVVFTADLPKGPVYFLSNSFADFLVLKGLLDHRYKGDSRPIRTYITECFKEGGGTLNEVIAEATAALAKQP